MYSLSEWVSKIPLDPTLKVKLNSIKNSTIINKIYSLKITDKFINKFDKIQPSFDDYNDDFLDILSYIRISTGKNKTKFKKIMRTIIMPFCFSCLYLHVLTIIIGWKNICDLPTFSNRISLFSLFFIGTIKWNHYILNFEKVKNVIKSLRICHELCQKISNVDIGNYYY